MRIFFTGGTGLIGRVATARLLEQGHDVRIFDLAPETDMTGIEYVQGNIVDFDSVVKHIQGCDAVIHMAALRNPNYAPGPETFHVNVTGTYNVFEAAAKHGIRRIVQASSINALGAYYNLVDMDIRYFPIDEDHPTATYDPYSFSKQMDEDIGAYYWRRDGISSVAMRYPGVYNFNPTDPEARQNRRKNMRRMLEELAAMPEHESRARITDVRKRILEYRTLRPFEFRPNSDGKFLPIPGAAEDPLLGIYNGDRFNLWASLDNRDAAQSIEKALTADYEGAHPLFVNSAANWTGVDSRTLIRLFFPEVTEFRTAMAGAESLVSIAKARNLIGFEPAYPLPE